MRSAISDSDFVGTPETAPTPEGIHSREADLREFVERFSAEFCRRERRDACVMYLTRLLENQTGKQPALQAPSPDGRSRMMQHFVNNSPWDHDAIFAKLRRPLQSREPQGIAALVLGEFHVNKCGRHSAGVARHLLDWSGIREGWFDYWCRDGPRPPRSIRSQMALTWTWADAATRVPVAIQLHLPPEWSNDTSRLKRARVLGEFSKSGDRCETALNMLFRITAELPPYGAVALNKHYGGSHHFLTKLERNGVPYVAEVPGALFQQPFLPTRFFPIPSPLRRPKRPWWGCGNHYGDWLDDLLADRDRWMPLHRVDADGDARYLYAVRLPMIPLVRNCRRLCRERWLIIEKGRHWYSEEKYYISNLPPETRLSDFAELVSHIQPTGEAQRLLHARLNAGHFEGRSWRGFHHHVTLCLLAGEFLKHRRWHAGAVCGGS